MAGSGGRRGQAQFHTRTALGGTGDRDAAAVQAGNRLGDRHAQAAARAAAAAQEAFAHARGGVGVDAGPIVVDDHLDHGAVAPDQDADAPAQRYATDAPLRENMAGIRDAVAALEHAEHGHLDAGQVGALADKVNGHVRTIVAECKLPPDADAALHAIIVPLVQQANALKAAPQDLSPVAGMREALDAYNAQFVE
jgi:hypothetical protein